MGARRLRVINGLATAPVDTLGLRTSDMAESPSTVSPASPLSKRRQLHGPRLSPYFTSFQAEPAHETRPSTRDSSHDDLYERRSTSSAGKSLAAVANLAEYRNAHPKVAARSPRVRKSRSRPSPADGLHPHPSPSSKRAPSSHGLEVVLPPFKVRRTRPQTETVDLSDDQLALDTVPPRPGPERKRTSNFSRLQLSPRLTRSAFDIQPTSFAKPPPRGLLSLSPKMVPKMLLRRAVCGKNLYDADSRHAEQLFLCPESANGVKLVAVTAHGLPSSLDWLRIDLSTIFSLHQAKGYCNSVHICRPSSANPEGKLWLEFDDARSVKNLTRLTDVGKVGELSEAELRKKMDQAVLLAKQYSANQKTTAATTTAAAAAAASPPSDQPIDLSAPEPSVRSHHLATASSSVATGREKLKDKLRRSLAKDEMDSNLARNQITGPDDDGIQPTASPQTGAPSRRWTRSSAAQYGLDADPDRWTSRNPNWRSRWHRSLVFPASGKNRATVDADDIPRLDEGEFLNDNLISFYLRHLQAKLERERPELVDKVYFFSTFFFEKLRSSSKAKINYDGVKAWTAKFDLLSYQYIIVPVNEHAHWYLAIICNVPDAVGAPPPAADADVMQVSQEAGAGPGASSSRLPARPPPGQPSSARSRDPARSKIITLDSLGSPHTPTCRALREYLAAEAKDKKGLELATPPAGMCAKGIPQQTNFCDCGVFVLGYTEAFLKDPDEVARKLLQRENLGWQIEPAKLREKIRNLLFDLQREQEKRLEEAREEKRTSLAARKKRETKTALPTDPVDVDANPHADPAAVPEAKCDTAAAMSTSTSSSSRPFFSAPSSPHEELSVLGVKLGTATGLDQEPDVAAGASPFFSLDVDQPPFVRELSSSSASEGEEHQKAASRARRPSVELVAALRPPSEGRVTRQSAARQHAPSPSPGIQPSSASAPCGDPSRRRRGEAAGYDGIDRSVDLT